jgi:hypothetical protein
MPTQEQYEQSDVGKAETKRIQDMVKDSPFWKKIIDGNAPGWDDKPWPKQEKGE